MKGNIMDKIAKENLISQPKKGLVMGALML